MSHAAAEACTQRLAAGRGDGYRLDDRSNGEAASHFNNLFIYYHFVSTLVASTEISFVLVIFLHIIEVRRQRS